MQTIRNRARVWAVGLCTAAAWWQATGASAQAVLYDGDFANGDWTHAVLYASAGATLGPSGQVAAGGNPGAYQQSEHTLPGAFDVIYDGHLCTGCGSFDPAADGPILSITIEYDYIDLLDQIGFGTRNGAYVLQGGQHFIRRIDASGPHTNWTLLADSGITETDSLWQEVTASGAIAGAPDFSTNGAPMQFGYYTRNAPVPVRGGGGGLTQRWGVDDFRVTLCVPEMCNDLDDDCDGQTDEGFEIEGLLPIGTVGLLPVGATCYDGEGICFTPGRVVCSSNGMFAYCEIGTITPGVEGPPGDATCCNYEDDDCDGLQDAEDPDCAMPELCDYCDNDGDGQVDEDFPNLNDICTVGVGLCKKTGFYNCTTDGLGTACSAQPYPPSTEGPPQTYRCADGIDNDCDGLVDLDDPDCQEPEKCDGLDNDGDGQVDEDFPTLGNLCLVGQGQCTAAGTVICRPDGTGTMCSASPGKGSPEGPVSCDCADGIDNDCDGLVDLNDPDCGGSQLAVHCALVPTCGPLGDDCKSWHTVDFEAVNGAGGETLSGTLLGLDTNGEITASIEVEPGDTVRLASRTAAGDFVATTTEVTLDLGFFAGWDACMTGPNNAPYPAGCAAFDSDCDDDIDLVDHAALQVKINQTIKYHELAAPTPLLHVHGEDGLRRADAFCSNMPFVGVIEPDETVVVSSEGENISRIRVALPQIDPASLFLKIDGVDVFTALGLDPATDFPGGPFGGQVDLTPTSPGCIVDICDLRVDLAPVGALASHTLSMYVENYCCGGHVAVLTGSKRPGSLSDTPNPECHVDDLHDGGVAQVFEVFIQGPTDGQITPGGGSTPVTGEVCHGRELVCPFPTMCPPMVKLNGLYTPLGAPAITLGDGENSADTYVYPYTATLQDTDLVQEVINSTPVHGTLDPGANRLIAEANDPLGNAAFDNVVFAIGPVHVFSFRGGNGIDKGLNLAVTPTGLDQVIEPLLVELLDPLIQEIRQWLVDLDGEVFPIDVPGTSCDPDITIDIDQGTIDDLDVEQFTFDITPALDQIDITVNAPDASASAQLKGGCKIKVCSTLFPNLCWCLIKFTVNVTADATITGLKVEVTVTEDDILTPGEIQPTLVFDDNNVDINIAGVDIEAGCIGGVIIQLFQLEDEVEAILLVLAQYYIDNELDISQWMNFVDIPALEFDVLDLDDVDLAAAMLQLGFEKTDVQITPTGMAIAYETTFTPVVIDPEVADIPGIPKTDAPLPVPFIPAADNVAVSISDDAINQLLHAMCRTGALITQFEDDTQTIDDLLPPSCNSLAGEPTQQGACVGLRGGDCTALPAGLAEDTCNNVTLLSDLMGIDASTLLLLHGRVDVSPKLLMFDNPGTPTKVESALRLSQLSVGIVADRDGNGTFSASYDSLPACTPFGLGADCALWEACLDIDFFTDLSLTMDGQVPVLNTTVTSSVPSTGTMCSGGMGTPGNPFDDLAQSLVVQLLTDLLTDNTPPLRLEGLDFGGVVTLQNPRLIAIENDGNADFDDYLAITADPVGD